MSKHCLLVSFSLLLFLLLIEMGRVESSLNELCDGKRDILPHPDSCNKFIKCGAAKNQYTVFDCPPTLVFNPILLVCDWPYNVDCKKGSNSQTTTMRTTYNSEQTNDLFASCSPGKLLPNPRNCSQFVICGQVPIQHAIISCNPPLLYNPNILGCDWPQNVNCQVKNNEPTKPQATTAARPIDTYPKGN